MQSFKTNKGMITRVKISAFKKMRQIALQNDGIIFGGYVRDEYISEYYTEKFNRQYGNNHERYWDASFMPETKARLLISNDIDISFAEPSNADNFINNISSSDEFKDVQIHDVTDTNRYYGTMIKSIRELRIEIVVGAIPFVYEGHKIYIKADIVIPKYKTLEPPFRNLDMLCNGFIIKKNCRKQFSPHTGTLIDFCTDYERASVVAQILKHMKDFKTVLCFSVNSPIGKNTRNLICMKRIEKMQNKKISWNFINMPFKTNIYSISDTNENKECGICSNEFIEGDKISYTTSQKDSEEIATPYIHYNCCIKHLKYQMRHAPNYHDKKFIFRCPYRNEIDFTRSALDIQFVYNFDL